MAGLQGAGGEGQDDSAHGLRAVIRLGRHVLSLSALLAFGAAPAARAVELMLEAPERPDAAAAGLEADDGVQLRWFKARDLEDPIVSGRLSARMQNAEGAVVVGFAAAEWAVRELEGVRVHLLGGASRVPAAVLKARGWGGEVSYPAAPFIELARRERWRRVGVLHAPGYEQVLRSVREAASAQGVVLEVRAVAGKREIPAAARDLAERCSALWVLGDPMLTRGAGFDFLVELSLSKRIPLLAPDPSSIESGAYAAWAVDEKDSYARAAAAAKAAARSWPPGGLSIGTGQGQLRFNEVLRRKWGVGGGR